MNKKVLVLEKNSKVELIELNKDKIVIGRDATCDVVLDDGAISRKHAVVLVQFDQVYIENVSSSGQILRGEDPVEYVQMDEEAEFHLGPYTLFWKRQSETKLKEEFAALEQRNEMEANAEDLSNVLPDGEGRDPNATVPSTPDDNSQEDPFAGVRAESDVAAANPSDSGADNGAFALVASDVNPSEASPESQGNEAPVEGFEMGEAVDTAASTRLTDVAAKPILKILKGEEIGRQIKLDYGFQWVVGRSPRCHIQINNPKLSRQHFKIYKVGNAYRIQDLGSAHGTKVNGVTVTDAPLQPFDAIQAGPVEVQYLLVDAKMSDGDLAQLAAHNEKSEDLGGQVPKPLDLSEGDVLEKTDFAPPVPYSASPFSGQEVPREDVNLNFNFANADVGVRAPSDEEVAKPKGPLSKVVIWYKAQPKPKQIGFLVLCLLIVSGLVYLGTSESAETPQINVAQNNPAGALKAKDPKPSGPAPASDLTQSTDVSPEYDLLPEEQKLRIRELYAKAERAKAAKNWQEAFDLTSEITRYVKRYKKTTDILLEAQSYVTDKSIGNLAPGLKDNELAQKEVAEQVKTLCSEGEKAIKEERWEDAQETYRKAFNLDPKTGSCAEKGYRAAFAKDPKLLELDVPKVAETPKVDPEQEKIKVAREDYQKLLDRYSSIKEKIIEGKASESLPGLFDLKNKVSSRIQEYQSGGRAPASIKDELVGESKNLLIRIDEGIGAMKAKLKADYQVQLADADQFIANKQYATAREIYDRILDAEPRFEEVIDLREKLYSKIISEARNKYQEGIIYESVGDVDNAIEGYEKTKELLTNVNMFTANEYYNKAVARLGRLKR